MMLIMPKSGIYGGPARPQGRCDLDRSICAAMASSLTDDTRYAGIHGFQAELRQHRRDESLWHIHTATTIAIAMLYHEEPIQRDVIPMVPVATSTAYHRGNSGSTAVIRLKFQSHVTIVVQCRQNGCTFGYSESLGDSEWHSFR